MQSYATDFAWLVYKMWLAIYKMMSMMDLTSVTKRAQEQRLLNGNVAKSVQGHNQTIMKVDTA